VSGEWQITDEPYIGADVAEGDSGGRPRRLLAVVVAVGLVVAIGLVVTHDRGSSPSRQAPAHPVQAPAQNADALDQLIVEAHLPGALTDYIRAAATGQACVRVAVGHSPRSVIAAALHRSLPQLSVVDSSEILDQFTALCSIEVRARDDQGTIAVISATAPSNPSPEDRTLEDRTLGDRTLCHRTLGVSIVARSNPSTASTLVCAMTERGWAIRVGATGPPAVQPMARDLLALAQDPTLTAYLDQLAAEQAHPAAT
jgi:hypothetical protein